MSVTITAAGLAPGMRYHQDDRMIEIIAVTHQGGMTTAHLRGANTETMSSTRRLTFGHDIAAGDPSTASPPYTRGTPTERITTARVRPGRRLLTTGHGGTGPDRIQVATRKTGAIIRTVADIDTEDSPGSRRPRRYRLTFTDGEQIGNLVPITSWHLVRAPAQPNPTDGPA